MKEFYEFASGSPFLTFFIIYMIIHGIVGTAQAIFGNYHKGQKNEE